VIKGGHHRLTDTASYCTSYGSRRTSGIPGFTVITSPGASRWMGPRQKPKNDKKHKLTSVGEEKGGVLIH